ncbi:MAG: DnaJ C-terminal domain-containing protein [bacterium]|nr:DnaJ C-terminal domain-containing protein [bacterium]
MEFKDYYKTLGVEQGVDQKAVSRAFRRLARESHPDVNKRKGAEDRFKEINEAYQVLSDPARRAQYDQVYEAYKSGGVHWQDVFGRPSGGRATPGGVTFTVEGGFEDLFGRGGGSGGGFSDFFQQLFGGLGGAAGQPHGAARPRRRTEVPVEITLEEAFGGAQRRIEMPRSGQRVDAVIPRGVRSGQTVRLPGAAGGADLYLKIQILPHRLFERTDDDLTVVLPTTVSEAALGAEIQVPTLEGAVTMRVPPETQNGRRLRLKGLGMPHARGEGRGDLYVKVNVVIPTGLSARERELFGELGGARSEDPRKGLFS